MNAGERKFDGKRIIRRLIGVDRRPSVVAILDRAALAGIALGFTLVFQPWGGTLRAGFFVTAFFTILHIVTSHLNVPEAE